MREREREREKLQPSTSKTDIETLILVNRIVITRANQNCVTIYILINRERHLLYSSRLIHIYGLIVGEINALVIPIV